MELGLGTAQFGTEYGISNEDGKVPKETVSILLEIAYKNGIRVLDTAYEYGDSETVLGETIQEDYLFRVISKLPQLKKSSIKKEDIAFLKKMFHNSLQKLKREKISGLLSHYPYDLLVPGGNIIYAYMRSLKDQGYVEKIGVSIYTGEEIDQLFYHYDFDIVQLPLNVLNQQLIKSGHITKLKAKNVEIHVRSAFLQGLLLMPLDKINPYFTPIMPVLEKYKAFLDIYGLSPVEGAFNFFKKQPGPDVILMGITNVQQLRNNIEAFKIKLPSSIDFSQFAVEREDMINPVLWNLI